MQEHNVGVVVNRGGVDTTVDMAGLVVYTVMLPGSVCVIGPMEVVPLIVAPEVTVEDTIDVFKILGCVTTVDVCFDSVTTTTVVSGISVVVPIICVV